MTIFIKLREVKRGTLKEGAKQRWVEVTKGLMVLGWYDTLAQAQDAHPQAVIAAGHKAKLKVLEGA